MAKVRNNWQNKLKDFAIMNMILFGSQKVMGMDESKNTRASKLIVNETSNKQKTFETFNDENFNLIGGGDECNWKCTVGDIFRNKPYKNGWFWTIIGGGAVALTGIGVGIYYLVKHFSGEGIIDKLPFCRDTFNRCPYTNLTSSLNTTLNNLNLTNGTDFCFGDMYPIENKYGFILNNNKNCTLYTSEINTEENGEEASIFTGKKITNIEAIKIPKNAENIALMFAGVEGLKNINVTNLNTNNVKNTTAMFAENPLLDNIIGIEKLNFAKVKDVRGMFYNTGIKKLNLKGFENSTIENADFMFTQTSNLNDIENLDLLNTSLLNSSSNMFSFSGINDTAIKKIENWNTTNLKDVSYMFSFIVNANKINLTKWNTDSIIYADGMFEESSINEVTLKGFKNLESANSMFESFFLNKINGVEDLELPKLKYAYKMFANYINNNGNLNLSKLNAKNLLIADGMFENAKLNKLILSEFLKLESANSMFKDAIINNLSSLSNLKFPLLRYGSYMFSGLKTNNLNITFLDNTLLNSADRMFENSEIDTLIFGNLNNVINAKSMFNNSYIGSLIYNENEKIFKSLINANYMFCGASGQDDFDISDFSGENINSAEGMFKNVVLTKLTLPDFPSLEDGNSMFYGAKITESLELPSRYFGNLKNASSMFFGFSGLTNIDLTTLNSDNILDTSNMFSNVTITSLKLPRFRKLLNSNSMFKNSEITSLSLGVFNELKSAVSMFENAKITTFQSFTLPKTLENANMMFAGFGCKSTENACELVATITANDDCNIENINNMFSTARLNSLTLNGFKNLKKANSMFSNANITNLILPVFDNLEEAEYMFKSSIIGNFGNADNKFTLPNSLVNANSMFEGFKGFKDGIEDGCSVVDEVYSCTVSNDVYDLTVENPATTHKLYNVTNMFKDAKIDMLTVNLLGTKLKNGQVMFNNSNIRDLTLLGFGSLENANYMFNNSILSKINLPSLGSLKESKYMFYNSKLNVIGFTSLDLSNLVNANSMFEGISLKTTVEGFKLNIDLTTESNAGLLVSAARMFKDSKIGKCTLMNVNNNNKLSTIEKMFEGSTVEEIEFKNWKTSDELNINRIFDNCEAKKVEIEKSDNKIIYEELENNGFTCTVKETVVDECTKQ